MIPYFIFINVLKNILNDLVLVSNHLDLVQNLIELARKFAVEENYSPLPPH